MSALSEPLQSLVGSSPLVHLSTINPDGSPQVSVIWIGLDGGHLVSGHLGRAVKVRNMQRDPRVVLSFEGPRIYDSVASPYAVVHARAEVEASDDAWELLDRLAKSYMRPPAAFPAPRMPGFIVRYGIQRVGGVGPWVPGA